MYSSTWKEPTNVSKGTLLCITLSYLHPDHKLLQLKVYFHQKLYKYRNTDKITIAWMNATYVHNY